jgi:DNA-binding response OmpR family regulator
MSVLYNLGETLMKTVLVIDDDQTVRDTLAVAFEQEGYRLIEAADGRTGLDQSVLARPDLILVDLRLPGLSGVEVCKQLRARNVPTPIIVLSAAAGEVDKVLLLEMGADDYIVKPFGVRELLARVHAVLRRTEPRKTTTFGENEVDFERRVVIRRGLELKFTPAEYDLLAYFLRNAGQALPRDTILNSVWGESSFPNARTVDTHVLKLRQKLEPDPGVPRHFLTVHGVGYRFLP